MLMCNLLERSSHCSDTTGNLCFYSEDEATNIDTNIANYNNFKSFEYKTIVSNNNFKSFEYKVKLS